MGANNFFNIYIKKFVSLTQLFYFFLYMTSSETSEINNTVDNICPPECSQIDS